jgi:SOS-response transcriptional repressor LexA
MGACALLRAMDPRDEQRQWLAKLLAATNEAPTALALRAGLAPTTLTRFLNNPEHATALSARTISLLEKATGLRYGSAMPQLLREREAEPYKFDEAADIVGDMVASVVGRANGVDPWLLRSRALEAAGYKDGDVLIVDLNAAAKPGDVVCAQVYEWSKGKAETVFRIWEPPALVSATHDASLRRPLIVDQDKIMIRGVVIASVRRRTGK